MTDTFLITCSLTSTSGTLLEKSVGSQVVKKFPTYYGKQRLITAFKSARQPSISWARSIQSMPPSHFLKIHINITLTTMSGSSKWSLSLRCTHQNPVYASPLPKRSTCPTHLILFDFISRRIYGEQYRSWTSALCKFSPLPCYLVPLRPKYSPQHPILKHPQPTLFPQYERPSFTPIQNNRQDYSSVYLNL